MKGNVHHYIGLAEPKEGEQLKYLQMVIYDSEHEVYNRSISQPGQVLDIEIIADLQQELDQFNEQVRMFKALGLDGENAENHVRLQCWTGTSSCNYVALPACMSSQF